MREFKNSLVALSVGRNKLAKHIETLNTNRQARGRANGLEQLFSRECEMLRNNVESTG
jgi:hypothetical protein